MTIFKIPILTTDRLRLRAFKASDLDAYAAMQANPEVMPRAAPLPRSKSGGRWPRPSGHGRCAATGCGLAKKSTVVRLSELSAYFSPSTGGTGDRLFARQALLATGFRD